MKKSVIGLFISSIVMFVGGFLIIYFSKMMPNINATITLLADIFTFKDTSYQIISICLWAIDGVTIIFFILSSVFIIIRKKFLYIIIDVLGLFVLASSNLVAGFFVPQMSNSSPDIVFLIGIIMGYVLSNILLLIDYIVLFGYLVSYKRRQERLAREKLANKNTIVIHQRSTYYIKHNLQTNKFEVIEKGDEIAIVSFDNLLDAKNFAMQYLLTNKCKVNIYNDYTTITKFN